MGSIAALLLSAAIALGSRMLRDFDSALLPYAVATVFLAFGLAHRCTARRSDPPAHLLQRPDHRTFLPQDPRPGDGLAREDTVREEGSKAGASQGSPREESLRRIPDEPLRTTTAAPVPALSPRRLFGAHSSAHWVARQLLLWGCLLAVLVTIPLVWGWLTFHRATGPGPGYDMRIWGFRVIGFDSSDVVGWIVFRGLDLAALLVIAGAGYFLWQRLRNRSAALGGRVAHDLVALLALLVVSVAGLLLTFSALFLHVGGYRLLSLLHMASVVFTLVSLPFGKFFPRVRRVGVIGEKSSPPLPDRTNNPLPGAVANSSAPHRISCIPRPERPLPHGTS